MSVIMFGLQTRLPSIVRQEMFCNYRHEEMRNDYPQHTCLRLR